MLTGRWSALPGAELARLMVAVVCGEGDPTRPDLRISAVRERPVGEGIDVPGWAMADAFELPPPSFVTVSRGVATRQGAEAETSSFREHGDLTVTDVDRIYCVGGWI